MLVTAPAASTRFLESAPVLHLPAGSNAVPAPSLAGAEVNVTRTARGSWITRPAGSQDMGVAGGLTGLITVGVVALYKVVLNRRRRQA
jgi:hypothetical protein